MRRRTEKPTKLCECGCGGTVAKRFVQGHQAKGKAWNWKGGRTITMHGYILVKNRAHPLADSKGYVQEHILKVEVVLGKFLKPPHCVHHVDENANNNANKNLVICEDNTYHKLIHRRMRALKAYGHITWRKCKKCGEYDDLENLVTYGRSSYCHKGGCSSETHKLRSRSKISPESMEIIRCLLKTGIRLGIIAERLGVTYDIVRNIKRGRTYKRG